jgi:hypothetical protein
VQVCLLQMPILVLISEAFLSKQATADHFTLVFPSMYTFTVFFSVILMNYIFQVGLDSPIPRKVHRLLATSPTLHSCVFAYVRPILTLMSAFALGV